MLLLTCGRVRGLGRSRSLIVGELAGSPIGVESRSYWDHHTLARLWGCRCPLALPPAVASTLGCGAFSSHGYAATLGHGGAHLLLLTASPPSPFSSVSPPRATLGTPLIDRSRPGILRRGWHAGHKSAEALAMWRSTAGWLLFTKTSVVGLARSPLPPPSSIPPPCRPKRPAAIGPFAPRNFCFGAGVRGTNPQRLVGVPS